MAQATDGLWGGVFDWPLIGLHAIIDDNYRVLTFGTDENGMQSGEFIYDVWDTSSREHFTLENTTPTDIFCSAAILIPGTGQILIGGGDARPLGAVNAGVADVNIYDSTDMSLTADPLGDMAYQRWYPTMVSLHSGQIVILGGTDIDRRGVGAVEMYTPGVGWRTLDGAYNGELAENPLYPRAWVAGTGEVIYFGATPGGDGSHEVYAMDPSGDGSLRQIGTLPFATDWSLPAANYAPGKALIVGHGGDVWSMDYSGATPTYEQMASLPTNRYWSDLTVMADGRVMLNGGGTQNSTNPALGSAEQTALIWDPAADTWTAAADEGLARFYHSATLLLPNGEILSLGGGAPGPLTNTNGEIYEPDYLFTDDGSLALEAVIQPLSYDAVPGGTLEIINFDTTPITRLTMVKTGATTHSFNMDQYFVDLEFVQSGPDRLLATLPAGNELMSAGNWMLFGWHADGAPSRGSIIHVATSGEYHDGVGDWKAEYFVLDPGTETLADVDFSATPDHVEDILSLQIDAGAGAFWDGGPTDDFAMRTRGRLEIAEAGDYVFYLTSDDGSALYIDDVRVVDNDGIHGAFEQSVTVALDAGWHDVEIRYFEAGGQAVLDLDWSGPGFGRKAMVFDGAAYDAPGASPPPDPEPPVDLLVNGGLEGVAAGSINVAALDGWSSDAGTVEQWGDGFSGVAAAEGDGFIELDNGALVDNLYQDIDSEDGQHYALTFSARQRGAQTESIEVYWGGDLVATVTPDAGDAWTEFTLGVTGSSTLDRLEFRELSGQNNGLGPFLDAIALTPVDEPIVNPDPDPEPPAALLANGGLEGAPAGSSNVDILDGWLSDAGNFEQWGDGFSGVTAAEGNGFIELDNGALVDNLYQDIDSEDGQHYALSFAARQRGAQSESIEVYWGGELVATVTPDAGNAWTSFTLGVTGSDALVRLEFRELAVENNGLGPFLDAISLTPVDEPIVNPDPDPEPPAALLANGGLEGVGAGSIRVAALDGWSSDAGSFEQWGDGFSGVAAAEGDGFIELDNGALVDNLFQDIDSEDGQHYALTFAARQRGAQSESIEVYWDGELVATVTPDVGDAWTSYTLGVTGSSDLDRLEFRELTGENNGLGPFLDAIALTPVDEPIVNPEPDPEPPAALLANGGLEGAVAGSSNVDILDGWLSDAGTVEQWGDGFSGVAAAEGDGFIELDNGALVDNLYQDIQTEQGKLYEISFAARQRADQTESIDVFWADLPQGRFTPGNEWTTFTLVVTGTDEVAGIEGIARLEFRELESENNGLGPFLDAITLAPLHDEPAFA